MSSTSYNQSNTKTTILCNHGSPFLSILPKSLDGCSHGKDDQKNSAIYCMFCSQSKDSMQFHFMLQRALFTKYSASQNYYYTKDINDILGSQRTPMSIKIKDLQGLDEQEEYLKREYLISEYNGKIQMLTEYYKFHKDISRLFMVPTTKILNKYHDKIRRIEYNRITKMLRLKENQNNEEEDKKQTNFKPRQVYMQKNYMNSLQNVLGELNTTIKSKFNQNTLLELQGIIHQMPSPRVNMSESSVFQSNMQNYSKNGPNMLKGFLEFLDLKRTRIMKLNRVEKDHIPKNPKNEDVLVDQGKGQKIEKKDLQSREFNLKIIQKILEKNKKHTTKESQRQDTEMFKKIKGKVQESKQFMNQKGEIQANIGSQTQRQMQQTGQPEILSGGVTERNIANKTEQIKLKRIQKMKNNPNHQSQQILIQKIRESNKIPQSTVREIPQNNKQRQKQLIQTLSKDFQAALTINESRNTQQPINSERSLVKRKIPVNKNNSLVHELQKYKNSDLVGCQTERVFTKNEKPNFKQNHKAYKNHIYSQSIENLSHYINKGTKKKEFRSQEFDAQKLKNIYCESKRTILNGLSHRLSTNLTQNNSKTLTTNHSRMNSNQFQKKREELKKSVSPQGGKSNQSITNLIDKMMLHSQKTVSKNFTPVGQDILIVNENQSNPFQLKRVENASKQRKQLEIKNLENLKCIQECQESKTERKVEQKKRQKGLRERRGHRHTNSDVIQENKSWNYMFIQQGHAN